MAGTFLSVRLCIRSGLILVAALAGCTDQGPRLSVDEARKCATDEFEGRPGTFAQRGNTIAYSYESPNGLAKVIVTFDGRRRPVSTFFESAPYGSHQELMNAAHAIKNCVAYGPKAQAPPAWPTAGQLLCRFDLRPDLVRPSEYLPEIWGGDKFGGEGWRDEEEMQEFLHLIMRHWNSVAGTLNSGDPFLPFLLEDDAGVTRANEWAQGFRSRHEAAQ